MALRFWNTRSAVLPAEPKESANDVAQFIEWLLPHINDERWRGEAEFVIKRLRVSGGLSGGATAGQPSPEPSDELVRDIKRAALALFRDGDGPAFEATICRLLWARSGVSPAESPAKQPCDRCNGQTDPSGATCPDCGGEGWQWGSEPSAEAPTDAGMERLIGQAAAMLGFGSPPIAGEAVHDTLAAKKVLRDLVAAARLRGGATDGALREAIDALAIWVAAAAQELETRCGLWQPSLRQAMAKVRALSGGSSSGGSPDA
jgi:hypothetical protein